MKLFLFWERAFFISSLLRVEKEADEGGTLHAMANKSFVITSILVKDHHIIILITITSILAEDQSITMTYIQRTEPAIYDVGGAGDEAFRQRQVHNQIPHTILKSYQYLSSTL